MSPKRWGISWLAQWLDVRNFFTGLAVVLASAIVLALVAAAVEPSVGEALVDIFTIEVWVWVVVVALIVEAGLWGALIIRARRRRKAPFQSIREVSYGGVAWPVTRYSNVEEYRVDAPICPADKTQLGLTPVSADRLPIPIGQIGKWRELDARLLSFRCLKCDAKYDLTGLGYGMESALEIVGQQALGEERAKRPR